MKIKEVEELTGIPSTNIRYYEKIGLLNPKRNENNYRSYCDDDIKQLERIKRLRILGVDTDDIRIMMNEEETLQQVLERRISHIKVERAQLYELQLLCRKMIDDGITYKNLNEETMDMNSETVRKSLWDVLREDQVKERVINRCFLADLIINIVILLGGIAIFFLQKNHIMENSATYAWGIILLPHLCIMSIGFLAYEFSYFRKHPVQNRNTILEKAMLIVSVMTKYSLVFSLITTFFYGGNSAVRIWLESYGEMFLFRYK